MLAHWSAPNAARGLIFDCDGTLADTMPIHYRAWRTMLARHGINFSEERFYQLGGIPTKRIIGILSQETGVSVTDVDAMTQEKEGLFLQSIHDVRPVPKVYQIAEAYRGRLPMAVASGGYREVVGLTLDAIGVREWFDAIVCAEDTERHKPEPDVFLEAARRIGVAPGECVVFEDTDIGLDAARRAGSIAVDIRPWTV